MPMDAPMSDIAGLVRETGSFGLVVWLVVSYFRDLRPLLLRIEAALMACVVTREVKPHERTE
jgi:hypothetical protein